MLECGGRGKHKRNVDAYRFCSLSRQSFVKRLSVMYGEGYHRVRQLGSSLHAFLCSDDVLSILDCAQWISCHTLEPRKVLCMLYKYADKF